MDVADALQGIVHTDPVPISTRVEVLPRQEFKAIAIPSCSHRQMGHLLSDACLKAHHDIVVTMGRRWCNMKEQFTNRDGHNMLQ
jgi:hypothetical protein